MEEALVNKLLSVSVLTDIVGSKIRWGVADQEDAAPYLVLTTISGGDLYTYDGASDVTETRVQFDAYGVTSKQARDISEAVRSSLSGGRFSQTGVSFKGVFFDNRFGPRLEGNEPRRFRMMRDARVWHSQSDDSLLTEDGGFLLLE